MKTFITRSALALGAPLLACAAMPAQATVTVQPEAPVWSLTSGLPGNVQGDHWNHGRRHRGYDRDDGYGYGYGRGYNDDRRYYDEPVYRNTRVWRGDDGRYYCRRSNGTTGLIIGGAAGALLGREVAGPYGDRTLGAVLGAAGGALLGRSIDRGNARCR